MKKAYRNFRIAYVDYPDYPETERFVGVTSGTIYINRAARPGAKVIRLIFQ